MSAPVDVGLFFVEVQQSITAIGTFCDDLDDLTIAGEPAREKLAELLGKSIVGSDAFRELIEKARAALHYMRLHKYADQAWADDLEVALGRVQGGA